MADEGATDNAVDTSTDNSTSQEQQTEDAAAIPAGETTGEVLTETTTETTTEDPKGWDKDRQKRDEERALREKKIADELAQLRETVEKLTQGGGTKPATQEQKDDIADAETELAEAVSLAEQAEKSEDPFEQGKLNAKAQRLNAQAQLKLTAIAKQQREWRKEQESRQKQSAADQDALESYFAANPEIDRDKALVVRAEGYRIAKEAGYEGKAADLRMQEHYRSKLETLKKSKNPPAKVAATATNSGKNTPPGTKVTPASNVVRPAPIQRSNAADVIAKALMD